MGNDEGKSFVVMDFHRDVIDLFDDIRCHFLWGDSSVYPAVFQKQAFVGESDFCSSPPLILSMWRMASFSKYRLLMAPSTI
jgi:hypothetical protein